LNLKFLAFLEYLLLNFKFKILEEHKVSNFRTI